MCSEVKSIAPSRKIVSGSNMWHTALWELWRTSVLMLLYNKEHLLIMRKSTGRRANVWHEDVVVAINHVASHVAYIATQQFEGI